MGKTTPIGALVGIQLSWNPFLPLAHAWKWKSSFWMGQNMILYDVRAVYGLYGHTVLSFRKKRTSLLYEYTRRFVFKSALLTLLALLGSKLLASECGKDYNPSGAIVTETFRSFTAENTLRGTGLPLDTIVHYWKDGTWFLHPLGYRNPWPPLSFQNTLVDREAYSNWLSEQPFTGFDRKTGLFTNELVSSNVIPPQFAFWMPNKRLVERPLHNYPGFLPCENGRPEPSTDEYIVKFVIWHAFRSGSENDPAVRRFKLAEERLSSGKVLGMQRIDRFEHSLNGPISGTRQHTIYDDNGTIAVSFFCSAYVGSIAPPNPLCSGWVWDRSDDLILQMKFPADRGQVGSDPIWMQPVFTALELVSNWRVN